MNKNISLSERILISEDGPCFIIAEAGVNHNGSIDLARQLVDIAVDAGADAVKFQTFKAEEIATRSTPKSTYHLETTGSDAKQSWFELLKSQELDDDAHEYLAKYCDDRDILFLSTPYDYESVDLLMNVGVAAIKVASTDTNNHPLLRYIAKTGLPVILSTAMCTLSEVQDAVAVLEEAGGKDVVVLQCTGSYPTDKANLNILAMNTIAKACDVLPGFSDHSTDLTAGVIAVAAGARVYEKHFTISKELDGPDHRASLEPTELKDVISLIRQAEMMLGCREKVVLEVEKENRLKLRKYAVATRELSKDELLDETSLAFKRTGGVGVQPDELPKILGRRLLVPIGKDCPVEYTNLAMDEETK